MTADHFTQNICEHAQPFYFEEPVILIRHDDSWSFAGFQIINLLDETSWITFATLFIFTICLLTFIDKSVLYLANAFNQSLSSAFFTILGVVLGKGMFARSNIFQIFYYENFYLIQALFIIEQKHRKSAVTSYF